MAIVSFHSDYEDPLDIPNKIPHIYFEAEDLNENDLLDPTTYKEDQFKKTAKFIKQYVNKGYNLLFQCEAGVSRSAGCAAATEQYYKQNGIKYFVDYNYKPNKVFYNSLLKELEEKK